MQVTPVTSEQSRDTAAAGQPVQAASATKGFNELMAFFSEKKGLVESTPSETKSYTVQRGDNLWQICRTQLAAAGNKNPSRSEVNAMVKQVAQSSGLKDADILGVGQKLDLSPFTKSSAQTAPQPVLQLRPVEPPIPPLVPAESTAPIVRTTTTADPVKAEPPVVAPQAASTKATEATPATADTKTAAVVPDIKSAIASRLHPAFLRRREELLNSRTSTAPTAKSAETAATNGVDVQSLMKRRISPEFLRRNSALGQGGPAVPVVKSASSKSETADITMMIQSILEPGSVTLPDESKGVSPWSDLLGDKGRLSSGYGMRKDPFTGDPQFHFGVDIAAETGTKIYPYEPGTVKFSGWLPGTGQAVIVQHEGGLETVYGHASETLVKRGQLVTKETAIAEVGSTGRSTGPHLHFEARKNGRPIDPMPLLKNDDSLHVAKTL